MSALATLTGGCGYHVSGKADVLPAEIGAIAVLPFENATTEYKLEQYLTQAVSRELISRTRYAVVADAAEADATLRGAVLSFFAFPQNVDPQTGRATVVTIITRVRLTLWDRAGGVLYDNPGLESRERYEVSADPEAYFEERQAALERASRSMARTLVSAVLEMF